MSNNEIRITQYELENCNGNLKQLFSAWFSVPKVSSSMVSISTGKSADVIKSSLDLTEEVSKSFQSLLYNSIHYFESIGIAFQESDEAALRSIDTITKK